VTGVTGTSYTLSSPVGAAPNATAVPANTTVYFRVVAVDAAGSSAASPISNGAIAR